MRVIDIFGVIILGFMLGSTTITDILNKKGFMYLWYTK
jgi:hypothetical protein